MSIDAVDVCGERVAVGLSFESLGQTLRLWKFCPFSSDSTRETLRTRPGFCSIADQYPLFTCREHCRSDRISIRSSLHNLRDAMNERSVIFFDSNWPPSKNSMGLGGDEYH